MSVPDPGAAPRNELSLRGLILGVVITVVFTAANVFFGLRAGLTFNSSIPAAVISMAVLRMFQGVTLQENNMVQTVASAAGTLSSIIFVLPGLIMVGWWTGFPYWESFWICALGGVLGVMYSIPLRRALVTNSDLPYPEGIACAEVLKVGAGAENAGGAAAAEAGRDGLMAVIIGTVVSAVFNLVTYTQVFAADVVNYFRLRGNAVTGYDFGMSLALFGVGHLVGLSVGIAMLIGVFITWGGVMPWLSAVGADAGSATDIALALWKSKARFIGAGTIGVAAIWTLLKLVQPVAAGLASAMAASRVRKAGQGASLPRTEQDIPIGWVGLVSLVCLGPIGWLLWRFAGEAGIGEHAALLVGGGVVFTVLMSFVVSAVCGYMAGLIGSSNSPLSGVGYLVVICAALLLVFVIKPLLGGVDHGSGLVAFALFITAVVFAVATIANNNLQDLKTGQLVDATPWKQQVALIVGVVAGAAVIPPVMDMLNHGYGFAGAPGVTSSNALAAPQAALMSSLASGVIKGNLPWNMIVYGIAIGAGVILLDEVLAKTTTQMRVPPLAVGLGMYLPLAVTLTIVVGAVVGWYYDRWAARSREPGGAKQLGVLLASGMIVGESLVGVVLSFIVYYTGNQAPLALVGDSFVNGIGQWLGGGAFVLTVALLYRWLGGLTRRAAAG